VPQATAVAFLDAFAAAGVADVLAGESGGEHVDRLDLGPVDGGDVAVVGDIGPVVFEDASGVLVAVVGVVLAVPRDRAAEHVHDAQVEAAIAGAQAADAKSHGLSPRSTAAMSACRVM
jgi:hypothetical protein